jgi:hypothetical protein
MRILKPACYVLIAAVALGVFILLFLPSLIAFFWYGIP